MKIIRNGENGMKLLKLVIVDDEPILLQGLVKTYNWNEMGFEVAGQAQSGEQAIEVIKKVKPHGVLTDIRMKQVSGLMVMEEIQKTELDPVFIVLSAYRDFNYAQQACDLGAYAYLLKPQSRKINCRRPCRAHTRPVWRNWRAKSVMKAGKI